jgi:uncharacterized lipoprotein YajG
MAKKLISALFVFVLLAFAIFAGCSAKDSTNVKAPVVETDETSKTTPSQSITIESEATSTTPVGDVELGELI